MIPAIKPGRITMSITRIIALTVSLLLAACRSVPIIDLDTETRALRAADEAFAALSESQSPKVAFSTYLTADAIMLPRATEGAIEGYDAAMEMFGDGGDVGYQLLWQPQFAEVSDGGDMGWTWGQYQVIVGGLEAGTGKYVNIWKKQPDGTWKLRADIGNERPSQN